MKTKFDHIKKECEKFEGTAVEKEGVTASLRVIEAALILIDPTYNDADTVDPDTKPNPTVKSK